MVECIVEVGCIVVGERGSGDGGVICGVLVVGGRGARRVT